MELDTKKLMKYPKEMICKAKQMDGKSKSLLIFGYINSLGVNSSMKVGHECKWAVAVVLFPLKSPKSLLFPVSFLSEKNFTG